MRCRIYFICTQLEVYVTRRINNVYINYELANIANNVPEGWNLARLMVGRMVNTLVLVLWKFLKVFAFLVKGAVTLSPEWPQVVTCEELGGNSSSYAVHDGQLGKISNMFKIPLSCLEVHYSW